VREPDADSAATPLFPPTGICLEEVGGIIDSSPDECMGSVREPQLKPPPARSAETYLSIRDRSFEKTEHCVVVSLSKIRMLH
jgi:hypothetical protein